MSFENLADFIQRRMRMSHIYQPVVLMSLLENGGTRHEQDIARDLLSHDQSQIDYYTVIAKNMVGNFEQFSVLNRGGTMDVINIGTLSSVVVPVPPTDEQHELVSFIQSEIDKFDSLVAQAERAIELLQERRTALISAGVTVKIDVRQFACQEVA